jgi:hypothetical protein
MLTPDAERKLAALEKIETALANLYGGFSLNEDYSDPARRVWVSIMAAELSHARLFQSIANRAREKESVQIEIRIDVPALRRTVDRIKALQKTIREERVSESRAFVIGAFIEEELFEFSYSKRIKTNDAEVAKDIERVVEETREHHILLHNHALKKPDL